MEGKKINFIIFRCFIIKSLYVRVIDLKYMYKWREGINYVWFSCFGLLRLRLIKFFL